MKRREFTQNAELQKARSALEAAEVRALKRFAGKITARPLVKVKVLKNAGGTKIEADHSEKDIGSALLMEALGSADDAFVNGMIDQLASLSSAGNEVNERQLNFVLSMVKSFEPRNELEAMLAAQMTAVHIATMKSGQRLIFSGNADAQDSYDRVFNKLARTFAAQVEAWTRYRTGGEKVTVQQHVSVTEGGQAIVGNITQAPSEKAGKPAAANGSVSPARMSLPCQSLRKPSNGRAAHGGANQANGRHA
jgi:hypothetical protein